MTGNTNLDKFFASKTLTDATQIELDDEPISDSAWVYQGSLIIWVMKDEYYLQIGNQEYSDKNLYNLELILFDWAEDEGWFE